MKNSKKGISLIVLIITIIVIVILATAILVSVISNNPISEANKARYESDRDNMQAVFTNTVGKIMAENQGTVNVTAGQINTETTGVNEATGEVAYTVDNAMVVENASGKIIFDKGTNTATTCYTGKKLPIYAAGETKWYVDSEGVLSLEVAGVKYGSGEVEGGSGSGSEEETLAPGLYDENGTMTKSWEQLLHEGYLVVSDGVLYCDTCCRGNYGGTIFDLTGKLVVDNSVESIGDEAFSCMMDYNSNFNEVILPKSLKTIGYYAFNYCLNLISITIPENVINLDDGAFYQCSSLTSVTISDGVTSIGAHAFSGCENLTIINYTGTEEQWNSINLKDDWNSWCPEITVHCTDGDIIIPAWTE